MKETLPVSGSVFRLTKASLLFLCTAMVFAATARAQKSMQQDPSLNNLEHPPGYRTAKLGELGRVKRIGRGKKDMILIPGSGFSGDVFDDFMEANKDRYTMYAITPPGYGGTPAPPMPQSGTSYGDQTWNRGIEKGIIEA